MRIRALFALIPLAVLALYLVRVALWDALPLTGSFLDDGYSRVSGVVHVHTTLSDGGGTPENVIAAASAAGLDFVVITDHNNLDAKEQEGYHDDTLVLVGSEISTTTGHVLGLGLDRDPDYRFSRDPLDGIADIRELGGIAFAAHPTSPRDDLRWTDWELGGPWGLEIVNGDSEWRRAGASLFVTLGLYPFNPRYALLMMMSWPGETLDRWDDLLSRREAVGLYGADAHRRLPLTENWTVNAPSYEAMFSLAKNHVLLDRPLTGDAAADREAVLSALRAGRSFMAIDGLAPAKDFAFFLESTNGERWTMGEGVPVQPGLRARAGGRMPAGTRVRLLKDGEPIAEAVGSLDEPLDGEGVYRVEATVDGWAVPWVLTNPIAVFDPDTLDARAADWPARPGPIEPTDILDDFDGETAFVVGKDSRSELSEGLLDPAAGVEGGGALRLEFRLAEPTPDSPDVFVAAVSWEHRDLSRFDGLTFSQRADGIYRMWVQVRDENPASADEGTEWWFASVKTGEEWERVSVPFATLRSTNPQTDGQLDLDEVRALVFVIDKGAVKPGTRGTIWLDDLGVY